MQLITRAEAQALGLKKYFTGKPCKHGHTGPRAVLGAICIECRNTKALVRAKEWAAKNPERYKANQDRYRMENAEKLRAYRAQYLLDHAAELRQRQKDRRAANPEAGKAAHKRRYANPECAAKAKARSKKWREDHPETYNEKNQKWRAENPEKARAIAKAGWQNRRARERTAGKIAASDVRIILARIHCEACGIIHPKMEIDHIIPLARGGTHHLSNLQLLCRPCNRSKWAKDPVAWARERGRLLD